MARALGRELATVDDEALDRPAAEVEEEVPLARDGEAEVGQSAVRGRAGDEVQVERVRDPADPPGPGPRLGLREDVGARRGVQAPLRQVVRSTTCNLGLGVSPGIRPRLAIGCPSISLMSPVKSMGLAPEM